jgi:hypothetical protein
MKDNFKKINNSYMNENIGNIELNTECEKENNPLEELIDNANFIRLLGISDRTSINWRKRGLIPYVKLGGYIYYKKKDVKAFIERNVVKHR